MLAQSTTDCMNALDFSGVLDASAIASRSVLMALTMAAAFASVHGIRMVSVNIPGTARQAASAEGVRQSDNFPPPSIRLSIRASFLSSSPRCCLEPYSEGRHSA